MNLSRFLLILRARYKTVLITLLATVLVTLTVALVMPKTYTATTSLLLNYKGLDPVSGLTLPAQLMPGYMATQSDIITSENVALRVVDNLKLATNPAVQARFMEATEGEGTIREWLANLLLKGLELEPSRDSGVLNISFKGSDPQFSAAVANAFADAYQEAAVQLRVEPSQKASGYFNTQIKLLRDQFEAAQNKVSAYQKEHNIDNADGRLDVESARLNDLSSQLVMVQALAMEANSRQRQASGNADTSPDIFNNGLIQGLKANLLAAEAKLADLSQRLGARHPQYIAAKSEVDKLRANLNEQTRQASSSVSGTARIHQQREAELRAALTEQRAKVMTLNSARDQLKVLTNEMMAAQRAYEGASQRLTQTTLEAQATQSDISVLNPAKPPLLPSSPKVLLLTLLAVFLGLMLGLGFGVLAEIVDRRVRSTRDLVEVLEAPVMGVLTVNRKQGRRRFGVSNPALRLPLNPG